MKVYLSQPMTKATEADRQAVAQAREALKRSGIDTYDPPLMEPENATIEALQEHDYKQMKDCDALLVVWTVGTMESRGCNAEMEWARRCFKIPIFVWLATRPGGPPSFVEAWPYATVRTSGGGFNYDLDTLLLEMTKYHEARRSVRTRRRARA